MNHPLVSIITPSYNKGPYIEETIQSIRAQTYPTIEHIVIDGGSTDETLSILRKYQDALTFVSEPDQGQSDAINKGWRMAKGEIIAYLNADDTYLPDAVERAVTYLTEHPEMGMVYGDGIFTDEHGRQLSLYPSLDADQASLIFCKDIIFQPSVFLRRSVYLEVGDIDTSLHLAMDLDYWIRVSLRYPIGHLPEVLSTAKVYGEAKTIAMNEKFVLDQEAILQKVFASPDLPSDLKGLKRDAFTAIYVRGGLNALHLGFFRNGGHYLLKGFSLSPVFAVKTAFTLISVFVRSRLGRPT